MKKALSIALIPIICFLLGMTAITADLKKPATSQELTGFLSDGKGHCFEIVGRPIETYVAYKGAYRDEAVITVTYLYIIDGSVFAGTEAGSRPGSFLKLHLINEYDQDGKFDVLTSVSGKWEIKDPNTSVSGASLSYTCQGAGAQQQCGEAAVENDFVVETGFTERIFAAAGATGSNLTVELLVDGTETWTFTAENKLLYYQKLS